jgi:hypothetical protein
MPEVFGHVWVQFKIGFGEISLTKKTVFIVAASVATVALPIIGLAAFTGGAVYAIRKGRGPKIGGSLVNSETVPQPISDEKFTRIVGRVDVLKSEATLQERMDFFEKTLIDALKKANDRNNTEPGFQKWALLLQKCVRVHAEMKESETLSEERVAGYYKEKLFEVARSFLFYRVIPEYSYKLWEEDLEPEAVSVLAKIAEKALEGRK